MQTNSASSTCPRKHFSFDARPKLWWREIPATPFFTHSLAASKKGHTHFKSINQPH